MLGRALVLVGIVAGLLAVSLTYAEGSRYVDDGTTAAFLIVLLSLTSWMPAEVGRNAFGAITGSAAFGFFLFIPAIAAFDSFGELDAGAWLGLCTVLIPIGALLTGTENDEVRIGRGPGLPAATLGLALLFAGIWFDLGSGGPSYWNVSSSGHAAGLLLIVLIVATALLVGAAAHTTPELGYPAVLVAAATFGFVEVGLVASAFGDFGSMGAGAWLEAAGGILLAGGIVAPQLVRRAVVPAPAPA